MLDSFINHVDYSRRESITIISHQYFEIFISDFSMLGSFINHIENLLQ